MITATKAPGGLGLADWFAVGVAITAGATIGVLDRTAHEVQGPLLLMMVSAFGIAAVSRLPSAAIGGITALAFVFSHLGQPIDGGATGFALMGLVTVIATMIAAAVGSLARLGIGRAANALPRSGMRVSDPGPPAHNEFALRGTSAFLADKPWHITARGSRTLLTAALAFCAFAGVPLMSFALTSLRQRTPVWLATIWMGATLIGWIAVTPTWIRAYVEITDATRLLRLATVALVVAGAHAAVLLALALALFIPIEGSLIGVWFSTSAVTLTLDVIAAVLIQIIAFASDVERHQERVKHDEALREATHRAALQRSQSAMLRAQLHPHFFLNALNATATLARRGDTPGVLGVVEQLGDLLRGSLAEQGELVTLAEELALVEKYLSIERVRFPDRLMYDVNVTEAALVVRLPGMLLQPLVENAIVHGIARRAAPGAVTITGSVSAGHLIIVVHNDGPSMTPDAPGDSAGTGLGLSNARARLDVLYGNRASITLALAADRSADVTVRLPADPAPASPS